MFQLFSILLEPLPRNPGAGLEASALSPETLPPLLVDTPTAFPGKEKSLQLP